MSSHSGGYPAGPDSGGGVTAEEAEATFWVVTDVVNGSVRYVSARAGYRSSTPLCRYTVTRSDLPGVAAMLEGGPVLVTVTSPWVDAWALQPTGYLADDYVREHLCGGPIRSASDGDVRALTLLVRYALNRLTPAAAVSEPV